MNRPVKPLIFTAAIALSLAWAGCAHKSAPAPAGPTALTKANQPGAQVKTPAPPRQYQGPPIKKEEPPLPPKILAIAPQKGWIQVDSGGNGVMLAQKATGALIQFQPAPTKAIGNAVISCAMFRMLLAKNGFKVSKPNVESDNLTAWFTFTEKKAAKPGAKPRKGIFLAKTMTEDNRYSVLVMGNWPAKYDQRLRKPYFKFITGLKLVDIPPEKPAPGK